MNNLITGIIIFLLLNCNQKIANYYHIEGYKCYKKENYGSAIEYYTKAIEIDKKDAGTYFARAMTYDKLGKTELAIEDYTSSIKYVSNDKRRSITYTNRGVNYLTLNEYEKAISDFETAIEIDSLMLRPYRQLARIYIKQGRWETSTKYLDKIISIAPSNAKAYSLRGLNYVNQNRFNEAIADYAVAIRLEPDNYILYSMRGAVYTVLGNTELALQDFNKGIELNPKNSRLFFMRGGLYQKFLKNREKAIFDFKKSANLGNSEAISVLKDFYKIDYPFSK